MDTKKIPQVIVVDDSQTSALLTRAVLVRHNIQASIANDGERAILLIRTQTPDLVILDIMMPGMNGFEVARKLRSLTETRSIPILMVTSLSDIRHKVEGLEAGADDFISKPFDPFELIARVRSLLRIKELHDELTARNLLVERVLNSYLSKEISSEVMRNPEQNLQLGGRKTGVSVMFADIRGFTAYSEYRDAVEVITLLNKVFNILVPLVFKYQGTLDKYVGDALMAIFGAPVEIENPGLFAVMSAWEMQQMFISLRENVKEMEGLNLGIGIATGLSVIGNVGSVHLKDYTVIGHVPNSASRLEEQARVGQILVDEKTMQACNGDFITKPMPLIKMKGLSELFKSYEIVGEKNLGRTMDTWDFSAFQTE